MINFRYHVVTLIAVFLALGLGVLFGASFIDQRTVTTLKISQERLGDRNRALRDRVVALQKQHGALAEFAASTRDVLIRDVLAGRAVVLLGFESSDDEAFRAVTDTVVKAGARLEGSFRLSSDLLSGGEERRRHLASVLETESSSTARLSQLLVDRLTSSLSGSQPGLFKKLIDSGLMQVQEAPGSQFRPVEELSAPGTAIVIVPAAEPDINRRVTVALTRALAEAAATVAVVEKGSSNLRTLEPLREAGLKAVTVDGVAGPVGQAGLALGLRAAFQGSFGSYGTGEGATALLPEPSPPGE